MKFVNKLYNCLYNIQIEIVLIIYVAKIQYNLEFRTGIGNFKFGQHV
jgi:hypothetical protein